MCVNNSDHLQDESGVLRNHRNDSRASLHFTYRLIVLTAV